VRFLFFILLSVQTIFGQTWTGAQSSLVSNSQNWNGGVPRGNSNAIFQSGRQEVLFNWPIHTSYSVGDLIFNSGASDFIIGGATSDFLRVGNIINNEANSVQVFNINIELRNNRTVRTEGEIFFNQSIFLQTGNGNLSFDGSGRINFGPDSELENITNLTLMNGIDLNLGGASLSFQSLNVTGPSIIDFGQTSQVSIESLTFSGNGSLTILNWSANDYFLVQNQIAEINLPKIVFSDFPGGAVWNGGNVTPVPEPSSFLYFFALWPIFCRKKR
jgi:hypothetical protein